MVKDLQADDVNTPEYQQALSILRSFQDNIELEYIYGIRDEGDRFSFTIDPSDDPGEFGEEIKATDALIKASRGTAAVDEEPYHDRWGTFYSSYSPVFDSEGNVACIVAVDFSAKWYEERIRKTVTTVIIVGTASTLLSIMLAFTVTARIRRRFTELYREMNSLAHDFSDLNSLIHTEQEDRSSEGTLKERDEKTDEITMLGDQIRTMQSELKQYVTYVHAQAYTDTMTGVGSKTAYLKKISRLQKLIQEGNADFAVAVFDMNGLKIVNDNYGHEMGDTFIIETADIIKSVFGAVRVYRIGGDEFIAVLENVTAGEIKTMFAEIDVAVIELNIRQIYPVQLTISKGAELFSAKRDTDYNQVFKRADEAMYRDKALFYRRIKPLTEETGEGEK